MKYLLILLVLTSCNNSDPNHDRKCKRLDTNTIEFLYIDKNYDDGDTIMYPVGATEHKYVILPSTIKLK